ncbi:hypothetical protein BAE44_0002322 [Dichanthelium oligosanthes]|uniref:Uncharacterized protein n=1 Tax=Dichanthelium oligosanthes TaxID=888268 RepID=A0A1E5WHN3_9POAL|nr:hypothetical protein BAE44_0002322 [Dichanthelium oligosanthes]
MLCCLRRRERGVEPSGGCGEAPARCVFMAIAMRQPWRGLDLVEFFCMLGCGSAVALRRKVMHSGNFLGAVRSASLNFLMT